MLNPNLSFSTLLNNEKCGLPIFLFYCAWVGEHTCMPCILDKESWAHLIYFLFLITTLLGLKSWHNYLPISTICTYWAIYTLLRILNTNKNKIFWEFCTCLECGDRFYFFCLICFFQTLWHKCYFWMPRREVYILFIIFIYSNNETYKLS